MVIWTIVGTVAAVIAVVPLVLKAIAHFRRIPEFPLSPSMANQIGLTKYAADKGYRIYWADKRDLHTHLYFKEYERIIWIDKQGKKWLLTSAEGRNSMPLWTKKSAEEIEQARQAREKQAKP